jgi:ribosomal protein L14
MSEPVIIERTDTLLRTSDGYVARFWRGRASGLIVVEVGIPRGKTIATGVAEHTAAMEWAEREIEIDRRKDKGHR